MNSTCASFVATCSRLRFSSYGALVGVQQTRAKCHAAGHAMAQERVDEGVRVNKCLKARFSRREADALVESGRVCVNDDVAVPGTRVHPGDSVTLDGRKFDWERLVSDVSLQNFSYVKYHKPLDVQTTTSREVDNNIIASLQGAGYDGRDRVFPVGRLDEATSGIIILTNDGEFANSVLGQRSNCPKEYVVQTDKRVTEEHVEQLRRGVVIRTESQRSDGRSVHVVSTRPCICERYVTDDPNDCRLRFVIIEGRNRQIRRMLGKVGKYTVRSLKRISFMGVSMSGIEIPNSWAHLDCEEMVLVRKYSRRPNQRLTESL